MPDGATAVGDAIDASLDAIRQTQPTTSGDGTLEAARIVLLSDGTTTVGTRPRQRGPGRQGRGRADLHRRPRHPGGRPVQRPARAARPRGHEAHRRDHRRQAPTRARTPARCATSTRQLGSFVGHRAGAHRGHRVAGGHRRPAPDAGRRRRLAHGAEALDDLPGIRMALGPAPPARARRGARRVGALGRPRRRGVGRPRRPGRAPLAAHAPLARRRRRRGAARDRRGSSSRWPGRRSRRPARRTAAA